MASCSRDPGGREAAPLTRAGLGHSQSRGWWQLPAPASRGSEREPAASSHKNAAASGKNRPGMSLGRARHGARRGAREGAAPGTNKGEVRPSSPGWRCPVTLGAIFQPQQSTNPLHLLASFPEATNHVHPPRAAQASIKALPHFHSGQGEVCSAPRWGHSGSPAEPAEAPGRRFAAPGVGPAAALPPQPSKVPATQLWHGHSGAGGGAEPSRAPAARAARQDPAHGLGAGPGCAQIRGTGGGAWAPLAPAPSPGQAGAAWAGTGHAEPPEPSSALAFKAWPKGLGREG